MNIHDTPTPETDALGYLPTDLSAAWPIIEHAQDLERRLTVAREELKYLEEAGMEGGVEDNDHYMLRIRKALALTAPRP